MTKGGRANPQIVAAIIGVIGVIAAAIIANPIGIRGLWSHSGDAGGAKRPSNPGVIESPGKPSKPAEPKPALRTVDYRLPGQGTPNRNGTIGDFCCTGETATIATTEGRPVGYVYVFGWPGQAFSVGSQTFVPALDILLSGSVNPSDPGANRDKGSVRFSAVDASTGAIRDADVGRLHYSVTLAEVTRQSLNGGWYFDLASAHVRVQASIP